MNTKAQFDLARKTIGWMVLGFMASMVVLYVSYMITSYQEKLTYVPGEIRGELISLRFTHIPDCFAVVDPYTEEVIPGTIDLSKFNLETMARCYKTEGEKGYKTLNFKLKLASSGAEVITNNYYHHDSFVLEQEVLVKEGNSFRKDVLRVYVQETV